MDNNDILRQLRYAFDFNDAQMIAFFHAAEVEVSRAQVSNWMKGDGHPEYQELLDKDLAIFLNGMINKKRGKQDGPQPEPEEYLNNNVILRKLKIALNLKDFDIMAIMKSVGRPIGKHELSAFFRNPDQEQYRPCMDQYLRNFIHGLQLKFRPKYQ